MTYHVPDSLTAMSQSSVSVNAMCPALLFSHVYVRRDTKH